GNRLLQPAIGRGPLKSRLDPGPGAAAVLLDAAIAAIRCGGDVGDGHAGQVRSRTIVAFLVACTAQFDPTAVLPSANRLAVEGVVRQEAETSCPQLRTAAAVAIDSFVDGSVELGLVSPRRIATTGSLFEIPLDVIGDPCDRA